MSSEEQAISVHDISKCFITYDKPFDRLKHSLMPRLQRHLGVPQSTYGREFWALRNIEFEVARGETVGIVGRNGSGKSTLLQIICGTLAPSTGAVEVQGRVAALLELGSGFNPEFTGRENVYLNATVLGLSREEIDQRFDAIVGFADIGDFIDQPVKVYSSGMAVRLAFAVQAQIDPDILIVDEALSVGDARFQAKCFERLRQLKSNGTSILLVTHASEQVVTHCNRAVLLEGGQLQVIGQPRAVINRYLDVLFGRDKPAQPLPATATTSAIAREQDASSLTFAHDAFATRSGYNLHEYRWGNGAASIMDFELIADGQHFPSHIEPQAQVVLHVAIHFQRLVVNPILGFTIKTKEGVTVYGTNSWLLDCSQMHASGDAGSDTSACLRFVNRLASGDYFISLGIASRDGEDIVPHDRRYDAIHFVVAATAQLHGLIDLALTMDIEQVRNDDQA